MGKAQNERIAEGSRAKELGKWLGGQQQQMNTIFTLQRWNRLLLKITWL